MSASKETIARVMDELITQINTRVQKLIAEEENSLRNHFARIPEQVMTQCLKTMATRSMIRRVHGNGVTLIARYNATNDQLLKATYRHRRVTSRAKYIANSNRKSFARSVDEDLWLEDTPHYSQDTNFGCSYEEALEADPFEAELPNPVAAQFEVAPIAENIDDQIDALKTKIDALVHIMTRNTESLKDKAGYAGDRWVRGMQLTFEQSSDFNHALRLRVEQLQRLLDLKDQMQLSPDKAQLVDRQIQSGQGFRNAARAKQRYIAQQNELRHKGLRQQQWIDAQENNAPTFNGEAQVKYVSRTPGSPMRQQEIDELAAAERAAGLI